MGRNLNRVKHRITDEIFKKYDKTVKELIDNKQIQMFGELNVKTSEITNIDDELSYIQNMIYDKFQSDIYIPKYFKIRESFPMASSTKRDFKKLKSENDSFIYKDFVKRNQMVKK